MKEWIENAENCGIPQFEKCAKTMRNWFTGIINSFSTPITNGFTEGCNNKIKVSKRNAYGYKISNVSETVFYIFFLINTSITNEQPPDGSCSHTFFHFNSYPNY